MPTSAQFRDPPPVEIRAAELRVAIARALFDAEALPAPRVAGTEFALTGIEADGEALRLDFARSSRPIVALFLDDSHAPEPVRVTSRWDGPVRSSADRAALPALVAGVRATAAGPRWEPVARLARELRDLPVGVPLEAFRMMVPGSRSREGLIRTGFHCNQNCGLCWQGRRWGRVSSAQIMRWIEDLQQQGAGHLVISGGEPTLDRELAQYIRHGRAVGFRTVSLETNAIMMTRSGYAAGLRDAGLTYATVSFHSAHASVSDAVTNAPGTHARTVAGIRALLDAGVSVRLNVVMTSETIGTLAQLPDAIRALFGRHPRLEALIISDLGSVFFDEMLPALLPDPAVVRVVLPTLIERALALDLRLEGLGSMCGPPPCMFDADDRVMVMRRIRPVDFREFVEACEGCAVRSACFGVRPAQLARFGDRAIRPIAANRKRRMSLPMRAARSLIHR